MFSLLLVGSMDTTRHARIQVACWLLLLVTCLESSWSHNVVAQKKRQTEVLEDLTKNYGIHQTKDVDEEAFSLEFSGEDYNTLVNLLLDAKNEFVKLQVNPNNPSSFRVLNDTTVDNETVTEEPVSETDTGGPLLRGEVTPDVGTENIYFNPVTPDPGLADPLTLPENNLAPATNLLAQLETVRDRKSKAKQLLAKIQGFGPTTGDVGDTDTASPPDEAEPGVQQGVPDEALKSVTTPCIPPPQYLPVAYPIPMDPASSLLYQPGYYPYPLQDGYAYPSPPGYNPAAPAVPQGRAEDALRASQPDGSFTSGDCLSYFCSRTVCTAWECTSDPCTSGQCVAKKCAEWSCDVWSNSTLTRVQEIDWAMQPDDMQYFEPLAGR